MALKTDDLTDKCKKIKAFLFDIDGVLTDGKIIVNDDGSQTKNFDIKDGFAIWHLSRLGFISGIITGNKTKLVEVRAKMMHIDFLAQGALEKAAPYNDFKIKYGLTGDEIAYIGDDLLDLPILLNCGLSAAPFDAVNDVKSRVDIVLNASGGNGAARELIELVLKAQDRWEGDMVGYYLSKVAL